MSGLPAGLRVCDHLPVTGGSLLRCRHPSLPKILRPYECALPTLYRVTPTPGRGFLRPRKGPHRCECPFTARLAGRPGGSGSPSRPGGFPTGLHVAWWKAAIFNFHELMAAVRQPDSAVAAVSSWEGVTLHIAHRKKSSKSCDVQHTARR